MSIKTKIESQDQEIRELLSSGYCRIPRFQRPYSWTADNIQEFWEDVVRDNPTNYFIGSMVVYQDGKQKYGVVDGQQRLTTIVIYLAVLRNKLGGLGFEDLAAGIQNLNERKNIDNKVEFILSSETSYPYFQDLTCLRILEPFIPGRRLGCEPLPRAASRQGRTVGCPRSANPGAILLQPQHPERYSFGNTNRGSHRSQWPQRPRNDSP
jgi:hypothetical protein